MTHGYSDDREALIRRLHRIEGQVRGIERMVEEDRYCIDILTQISAVETALESLALRILDGHVNHCVSGALASGDPEQAHAKATEMLEAVQRLHVLAEIDGHVPDVLDAEEQVSQDAGSVISGILRRLRRRSAGVATPSASDAKPLTAARLGRHVDRSRQLRLGSSRPRSPSQRGIHCCPRTAHPDGST